MISCIAPCGSTKHLNTSGKNDDSLRTRYVTVKGEKAKKVADGRKLHYNEWKALDISLGEEWEHISTHMLQIGIERHFIDRRGVF